MSRRMDRRIWSVQHATTGCEGDIPLEIPLVGTSVGTCNRNADKSGDSFVAQE
jgi:hypothetical protein